MGIRIVDFPRKRYKMFDPREASGIINISIAQRSSRGSSDTPEEQGKEISSGWAGWRQLVESPDTEPGSSTFNLIYTLDFCVRFHLKRLHVLQEY